jgi:hypothetical protein
MNIQQDKATLANLILSEISRRIADDWTKVTCTKSKYCYNDLSENEININFITENTDAAKNIRVNMQYRCGFNILKLRIEPTAGWSDFGPHIKINLTGPQYIPIRKKISAVYRQYKSIYDIENEALEVSKFSNLLCESIPHLTDELLLE